MKLQFLTTTLFCAAISATSALPSGLRRKLQCAGEHDHDCDGTPDHDADDHDSSGGGAGCFSKVTTVEVEGKGVIKMDNLEVGDFVRVGKDNYSQVFSFGHLAKDAEADFLQIHFKSELAAAPKEAPIELTARHMLFVDGQPVRADSVKVGDMLNDGKIVTDVKSVKRAGVFAPFTQSGEIMVNGVRASTYVAMMDHVPLNQHYLAHMFLAPQRMLCGMNFAWCEKETYTADGFSNWSNWAIQLYMKANRVHPIGQYFLAGICAPILSTWYTVEQLFASPLLALATVAFFVYKTTTKKAKVA